MPVPLPDEGEETCDRHRSAMQDQVALAEIELCGELMIAASAAEGPLSAARIDEVLGGAPGGGREEGPRPARRAE
ncbi:MULTISPECIES: hypothetical protein [Streptomyces]|uniref:Uncharacterized protein n=1 Tax=Streptomyces cacaoi TaxID=1898 RepID=A0A4Y3R2E5_STRCI|nr:MULTISPECIES: hypothetical protein [Streptomyces]NNG87233.1 hypothetical protein [Streptomyces cacaoi]QHF97818.1 hypothetical protein DEH18_32650 [Streptomyces sp. NHF165]GEB51469.1 hypothetical protein SCA03_40200 [Streptomyces cacaoi]